MDEQKTNDNLAEAMGMSADELGLDEPAAASEIIGDDEPTDEGGETTEFEMGDGDEGGDLEPEDQDEEHSEADDTADEAGSSMDYAESTSIKAALAGDGLPQDLIEALSEDQLRSYMAKRAERDAGFQRLRDKLNGATAQDETQSDEAEDGGAPDIEPDKPLPRVDINALAEEFGEEEASKIAEYVNASLAQVDQRVEAATAPLMAALEQMIDTSQRSRLEGMVPDGLEEGWYDGVRARAIELGNAGTFSEKTGQARQDALFDAALRLEHPDLPTSAEAKREERRAAQKRNGNASRSGRLPRKAAKLSKEDAMDARVRAAMEGKSVQEIQRLFPG